MISFSRNTDCYPATNRYLTGIVPPNRSRLENNSAALGFAYRNLAGAILVAMLCRRRISRQLPPIMRYSMRRAQGAAGGERNLFKGICQWISVWPYGQRCASTRIANHSLISLSCSFYISVSNISIANMDFSMRSGGSTLTVGDALHNLLYSTARNVVGEYSVGLPSLI